MKQKDMIYLLLAVVILLVAGYIGYTKLVPSKSGPKTVEVDKVGKIQDSLDSTGVSWISNTLTVVDYDSAEDLQGLNNTAPFGQ